MSYTYKERWSSNYSPRSNFGASSKPTGITIHHWGKLGQLIANVVAWLRGAAGGTSNTGTSAHLATKAGQVTRMVPDDQAAWHSGNRIGNGTTIGIECRPEMSDGDWDTLVELCADLEEIHGSLKYYRHSDWKATACPGKYSDQIAKLVKAVNAEHEARKNGTTTVGASKPAESKEQKKSKPKGGAWPHVALKRTDEHTTASHNAWVKLMEAIDLTDDDLGINLQSWLNRLTDPRTGKGYYDLDVYRHDGIMGPIAVKGLQRKLYDTSAIGKKHLYYGVADGHRGPLTVRAEIDYLNWQRQFVK